MKRITLLKSLLDILYMLTIICAVLLTVLTPGLIIFNVQEVPLDVYGKPSDLDKEGTMWLFIALSVALWGLLYSVYLLREIVIRFSKKEIFSDYNIRSLNRVGWAFILTGIFTSIIVFVYNIAADSEIEFELNSEPGSLLISLITGLFFMVLSEVFTIARNLKDENDLTI